MQLSQNQKIFLNFWLTFWNLNSILNILEKKMSLTAFVFSNLRTLKTYLDKCLKSQVWEDPSTSTLVNVPKHGSNLLHFTFIIFIDHCQVNWVGKSLSYWHAKSWDYLLTQLAADEKYPVLNRDTLTISIQVQLSEKVKLFRNCLLHFWNLA